LRADALLVATAAFGVGPDREELGRQLRQVEGAGGVVVRLVPGTSAKADVSWSRRHAFDLLVQHLRGLGHRELALVARRERDVESTPSVEACREAVAACGVVLRDEHVHLLDPHASVLTNVARALTGSSSRPTAVLVTGDEQAAALMHALRGEGVRVPADISVTGVGDRDIARVVTPALTTVRVPLRESGRVAMLRARELLDGAPRANPVLLPVELVVRDSTAPPAVPSS
jgi:LacI family transcriptional regulator